MESQGQQNQKEDQNSEEEMEKTDTVEMKENSVTTVSETPKNTAETKERPKLAKMIRRALTKSQGSRDVPEMSPTEDKSIHNESLTESKAEDVSEDKPKTETKRKPKLAGMLKKVLTLSQGSQDVGDDPHQENKETVELTKDAHGDSSKDKTTTVGEGNSKSSKLFKRRKAKRIRSQDSGHENPSFDDGYDTNGKVESRSSSLEEKGDADTTQVTEPAEAETEIKEKEKEERKVSRMLKRVSTKKKKFKDTRSVGSQEVVEETTDAASPDKGGNAQNGNNKTKEAYKEHKDSNPDVTPWDTQSIPDSVTLDKNSVEEKHDNEETKEQGCEGVEAVEGHGENKTANEENVGEGNVQEEIQGDDGKEFGERGSPEPGRCSGTCRIL